MPHNSLTRFDSLPTHVAPFQGVLHALLRSGLQSLPHLIARLSFVSAFLLLCWLLSGVLLTPSPGSLCHEPLPLTHALTTLQQEYAAMEAGISRLQHQVHAANLSHEGWSDLAQSVLRLPSHTHTVTPRGEADAPPDQAATNSSKVNTFLFVAVLSTTHNRDRRDAVRESWASEPVAGTLVRFILYHNEQTSAVLQEAATHGDIVFVHDSADLGYRAIVYKTYYTMEWVVEHVDARFILKTDDDTYVNLPLLVADLSAQCRHPQCHEEALYVGQEARRTQVIVEKGHKWANLEYQNHLNLLEYFPYMYGGGYVVSADVASTLVQMQRSVGLKFMPNEDATFGFWVSGLNLRHVDHPMIKTTAGHCSFQFINAENSMPRFVDASFREEEDVCSGWLLCHKIMTSQEMRYMHYRVQSCAADRALLDRARELAGSLRAHLEQLHVPHQPPPSRLAQLEDTALPPIALKPLTIYMLSNYTRGTHFFGDVPGGPWSGCGRWLLSHRRPSLLPDVIPTQLRPPAVGEHLELVAIATHGVPALTRKHTAWRSSVVGTTTAWNHHHGAFLQWVGSNNSTHAAFINDRCPAPPRRRTTHPAKGNLCTSIVTVPDGHVAAHIPLPIVAIDPQGAMGLSIDLCRLEAARPGHGMPHCHAPPVPFDPSDGVWLVDLASGRARLLLPFAALLQQALRGAGVDQLTGLRAAPVGLPSDVQACLHWLDVPRFSADGQEVVATYHIDGCMVGLRHVHAALVFTIDVEGRHLWRVPLLPAAPGPLAVDYASQGHVVVCTQHDGHVYLVQHRCRLLAANPRFLITDDDAGKKLLAWDTARGDALFVGEFWDDANWWDAAPGFHHLLPGMEPYWSPDGRHVVFQSGFYSTAGQQTFIVSVQPLQAATAGQGGKAGEGGHALMQARTRVLIDLAVRDGARLRQLCLTDPSIHQLEVHVFQTASLTPTQSTRLSAVLDMVNVLARRVVTHFAAVGGAESVTSVHSEGCSSEEVTVQEFARTVFDVHLRLASTQQRRGWLRRGPGRCEGDARIMVPTVNFGAWLQTTFDLEDHVTVLMDLGEGREVPLLESMLADGSLVVVDVLHVVWHHTVESFHRAALLERALGVLGVVVERLQTMTH